MTVESTSASTDGPTGIADHADTEQHAGTADDAGTADQAGTRNAETDGPETSPVAEATEATAPTGAIESADAGEPTSRDASDPEREGDAAADYLEELLDIADLDGDIDLDVDGDRAVVSLVGGDLDILVGREGVVLDALQDLTRLAVLRTTGHRSRLLLDISGWRGKQRDRIRDRAAAAVQSAKETGEPVALPPMSSYERKIVHDLVAELGLVSASEGDDPNRHVVVRAG